MGFIGAMLPFGLLLAFGYWESPWLVIVVIAVGLLLGGGTLIWGGVWDEVEDFCVPALMATGVVFAWLSLASILDGRGVNLFGRPSWILILYGLVFWLLPIVRGVKKDRDEQH